MLVKFDSKVDQKYSIKKFVDEDNKDVEGIEITGAIFGTAYNRNDAYFQVSQLMKFANKLERVNLNLNHYEEALGNKTRLVSIEHKLIDGEYEVWGTVRSTDPSVIALKDEITSFSIEISIIDQDIIADDGRYYFINIDWYGLALLTAGNRAGSGDARVQSVTEFMAKKDEQNDQSIMNYKEIVTHLEANPEEAKKIAAQFSEESKPEDAAPTTDTPDTKGDDSVSKADFEALSDKVDNALATFTSKDGESDEEKAENKIDKAIKGTDSKFTTKPEDEDKKTDETDTNLDFYA